MGKKKKKLSSTERWEEEPTGRNNNKKINCLELLCVCVYYFSISFNQGEFFFLSSETVKHFLWCPFHHRTEADTHFFIFFQGPSK